MPDKNLVRSHHESRTLPFGFALALLALVILLQVQNGAYLSDFGGHPDEAAHVVTGLMVRDYLAGPLFHLQHPMHYAQDYYDHFPKVALGHYPPGFYVVMGLWLLPLRTKGAILVFSALMTTLAASLTWRLARGTLSKWSAVACGLLFAVLPLVQTYTAIVMSDLMVVVLTIGALLFLQEFLEKGRLVSSLLFGTLAALAILTKAAGLFLAVVPPLAIILSGRWRVLTNWRLWMAPVPVIVLALPWMVYSWHITAEGLSSQPLKEYVHEAVGFYARAMVRELGWGGIALLIASILVRPWKLCSDGVKRTSWAVNWAVIIGLLIFYVFTPSGLDERYLLPLLPSALVLSLYGAESLVRLWVETRIRAAGATASAGGYIALTGVAAAVLLAALVWRPTGKLYTGDAEAVNLAVASSNLRPLVLLVSGTANTEGAVVAAAALHPAHAALTVIRATKALAETDWMGSHYTSRYGNPAALTSYLNSAGIDFVILDSAASSSGIAFPHEKLLSETLASSQSFQLKASTAGRQRGRGPVSVLLYER